MALTNQNSIHKKCICHYSFQHLLSSYLLPKNKKTMTQKYNFAQVSNLVTHNEGSTQTKGVREQVAEENIWT
jgi:hypothetical protein